jgi:4-hydroxy-tetrahydrodipicolinate synthase
MTRKLSVVVIINTPFDANGALDEAAYRTQLRRLNRPGMEVYVGGSASSEGYTLTPEERDRVLAIAVEELKGKVPVRAMGCEPHVPSEMVDYLKAAERSGVDAAQIFSLDMGHGAKPTVPEMERYYQTAIESTSLPIYLSSHRAAGYFLPLDMVERLVNRYPSIVGIAYGGDDIPHLAQIIKRVGDRIEVHCAGPSNALSVLGLGGNGFMGGEGNLSPEMVTSVIAAYAANDQEGLRVSFARLMAFAGIYNRFGGATLRGLKPLMNAFGLPGGTLRAPRIAITEEELQEMTRLVLQLNIPGLPAPVVGA